MSDYCEKIMILILVIFIENFVMPIVARIPFTALDSSSTRIMIFVTRVAFKMRSELHHLLQIYKIKNEYTKKLPTKQITERTDFSMKSLG
jgi:hypothetical protein